MRENNPALVKSAVFVDALWVLLSLVVPIFFVQRWKLIGAVLGVFFFWGCGMIGHNLMQRLDPSRDVAILDASWTIFGILIGAVYCTVVYLAVRSIMWLRNAGNRDARR